jgi:hypothetical protein
MKNHNIYLLSLLLLITASSCTKVINLDLGNQTGALVIEGNITNIAGPQIIKLTQNVSFSTNNTYPPVTGATVTVNDQTGKSYPFTEAPAGTYTFNPLTGLAGNTYTLHVTANGKSYQAISVMPATIALDSLSSKDQEFNTSKHKKVIIVHYQDPAGVANQYRFVMFVNNKQVKTVFAFNDDFNDGRNVSMDLRQDDQDDDNSIYAGDTVTVEMQCIDKPVYTYWFTLQQQGQGGPGGGVTPSNPPNNITPTALGYFSAHTTQTKTFIVK